MSTVRRVRLGETGWDEPLRYETGGALPEPRGAEVLIEVEACGVCHRDLLDREGRFKFLRPGVTPGHEVAGRVVAVGPSVTEWQAGDRVATMHRDFCGACDACQGGETSLCGAAAFVLGILADGGYATHLLAPERALYGLPEDLPAGEAAVLHCTVGTAYRDLRTLGGLRAGERVLVTGANGGVGLAAVQVAARLGAEVVAVVRSPRHGDRLRELGAREVVVDATGDFHKHPRVGRIDLALDTVGAPTFPSALRALRVGGRMVVVGNVTAEKVGLNLGYMITFGLTVRGGSGATRAEMVEVLSLHAQRPFAIPVRALPLARADEAQRLVRAGGLWGRVVLDPRAG